MNFDNFDFNSPDRRWIGILWGIWGAYWLASALRTKSNRLRVSSHERISYLLPSFLGLLLFTRNRSEWLSEVVIPQSTETLQFAIALVALGLGFSIWARWHLGSNWSASVTVKEQHDLIRTGPYAYVRHPIYTGMLAGGIGTLIADGRVQAFVGLALLVVGFLRKMQLEEKRMEETFGELYQKYKDEVRALIPYVY